MSDALIATGIPYGGHGDFGEWGRVLAAIGPQVAGVRRFGAASLDLAWVAAGRFDGFWEFALAPWDLAAGLLLVREAGGFVSDLAGGQDMMVSGDVLAANSHLHLPLAALIREAMRAAQAD
jgi:myo-inositol-1(or 4)-monophosphatase